MWGSRTVTVAREAVVEDALERIVSITRIDCRRERIRSGLDHRNMLQERRQLARVQTSR